MKKLLLSLACVAAFGMAQAAQVTETLTVDLFGFSTTNAYADVKYTSTTTGITYSGNMCKATDSNGGGMQFRTSSGKEAGLVATANPEGYKIVSVKATPCTGPSTTNQWDVYGNTAAYSTFKDLYSTDTQGTLIGSGTTTATVTPTADLNFFGFRANKNAIYIESIVIVYENGGAAKSEAGLEFSEEAVTVVFGETFTEPAFSKATDAAATFASDNEAVATVNATTGVVTIVAPGVAKITATTPATDKYYAGTASYTITVTDPSVIYSGLSTNMDDWTTEGTLPEGLSYVWKWDATNKYAKASAYVSGTRYVTDVRLVSPEFDLTNYSDLSLTFTQTANYVGTTSILTVEASVDGGAWSALTVDPTPAGNNWTFVDSEAAISSLAGHKAKIAFRYTSTETDAATWEVKNFTVKGKKTTSALSVVEANEAPVEYFNLQGIRVAEPQNGIFIRRQGNTVTKVLVK